VSESVHVQAFRARLEATRQKWLRLLEELCNIECGTEMTEGIAAAAARVAAELHDLGLTVEFIEGGEFAPHLVAKAGKGDKPIVLGGHLDTTYTDYAPLPAFHVKDGLAFGPGTSDMKGGVVVHLAALDCLKAAGLLGAAPIVVLLNSDEERGAPTSREMFQEYARTARAALFTECGGPDGELVVARRAKLSYRLDVRGVAQHAGESDAPKASALTALSHKIIELEALNARFAGASFNVGRAWGGMASNTVAAAACALLDVRYPKAEQETPIREAISSIAAAEHEAGCEAVLTLTSFRPVWPEGEASRRLFTVAEAAARAAGQSVAAVARGGTSDANWFGAAGVPCLDGLGPVGFDEHTPKEHIIVETLFERALLVALLLVALGDEEAP